MRSTVVDGSPSAQPSAPVRAISAARSESTSSSRRGRFRTDTFRGSSASSAGECSDSSDGEILLEYAFWYCDLIFVAHVVAS